jgi:hypothetical protein
MKVEEPKMTDLVKTDNLISRMRAGLAKCPEAQIVEFDKVFGQLQGPQGHLVKSILIGICWAIENRTTEEICQEIHAGEKHWYDNLGDFQI